MVVTMEVLPKRLIMPRTTKSLSDNTIKALKPKDKPYTVSDGRGLHILISTTGYKSWEFIYNSPVYAKRMKISLGAYPAVSLAYARKLREEYHSYIGKKLDVRDELHKIELIRQKKDVTYASILNEWLENEEGSVMTSTFKQKKAIILNFSLDKLGKKPLKEIKHPELVNIIQPLYKTKPTQARKLLTYFHSIWQFSLNKGYCENNICGNIDKRNLFRKEHITTHFAKITDTQPLRELIHALYALNATPARRNALKLMIFIPLRTENMVTLKWAYINFEEKLLTIPRAMMKVKKAERGDFKLPLSTEAIAILKEQFQYSSHREYVFATSTGKPLQRYILSKIIKHRLLFNGEDNERQTPHGLRGTFSSLCETHDLEHGIGSKIIEACLDHDETNKTALAYNHQKDYTAQKRILMQWWCDYILSIKD